jgi:hypothetical protein
MKDRYLQEKSMVYNRDFCLILERNMRKLTEEE